jgi:adenylate cyclase
LFEQALELEPKWSSAAALLASTYTSDASMLWVDSPEASRQKGLELARRAVQLDSNNWLAHMTLADALAGSGDSASGIAAAERAVQLNPSAPSAWWVLATAKDLSGDYRGALSAIEQSIRLDPQSTATARYYDTLAYVSFDLGEYAAGLEAAHKVVGWLPDYPWGYVDLAMNAVPLGHIEEARAAMLEARRIQPNLTQASIQKGFNVSRSEVDARRNAALGQAGLD